MFSSPIVSRAPRVLLSLPALQERLYHRGRVTPSASGASESQGARGRVGTALCGVWLALCSPSGAAGSRGAGPQCRADRPHPLAVEEERAAWQLGRCSRSPSSSLRSALAVDRHALGSSGEGWASGALLAGWRGEAPRKTDAAALMGLMLSAHAKAALGYRPAPVSFSQGA